jgi:hypothetical protein
MEETKLKMLTKLDFINIVETGINIHLCLYDISLDKLDIDLIEYIISKYGSSYSGTRNIFLKKLFFNKCIIINEKTELDYFNPLFAEEFSYRERYTNEITARGFSQNLYNFIGAVISKYDLDICNLSNQLFSKTYTKFNFYYNEDNNRFTGISQILEQNENYILYNDRYYHIDICTSAYTGDNIKELVPMDFLYEYRGEFYTMQGLDQNNLVYINGYIFDRDDCVYCEDTGNEIHIDNAFYCDESECWYENESNIKDTRGLRAYHKSSVDDKSNDSIYKIGFEIEKEDSYCTDFSKVRKYGWDAERDGSLDDNGFELVSPIYDLMDIETISKDLENIKDFINADYTSNCGGHINVSIKDKNANEIFELIKGYLPLLYAMFPNRIENRFCKAKKIDNFNKDDRYEAVNFTKGNILEFRIFGAVKNVSNLLFRYKLIKYMFDNQRKGAASVVRMLLIDSDLKKLLLSVYSLEKYNKLIDRVINYTDIYMSARDVKTTSTMITKMKRGQATLQQLINN